MKTRRSEHVVLLHGLCRTRGSMRRLERALTKADYTAHNLGYDSRHHPIEVLARRVALEIRDRAAGAIRVHLVTHSMGGILARQIQATEPIEGLGRAVMLAPPNQGSEVVDRIGHTWIFDRVNGPAGHQLGTDPESFVNQLGPVDFECGILTGDRSLNWIHFCRIPGPNDGKVAVARARVEGMAAFKVVPASHSFIMNRPAVIADVLAFLESGRFPS